MRPIYPTLKNDLKSFKLKIIKNEVCKMKDNIVDLEKYLNQKRIDSNKNSLSNRNKDRGSILREIKQVEKIMEDK